MPASKALCLASQASFRLLESTPSEPHPQLQVPTNSGLQILPGDEIVQVNEQVVVSEEEMDMVAGEGGTEQNLDW